jgi:peptidoglycan/LPS O-acetylase OafA/YrhL
MVLGYWRNVKTFIANSWPAATVLGPRWSFKVEEQSYVSFPLLVWVGTRKTLMILLASVAGALLFVDHSPDNALGPYLMPSRMDSLALGSSPSPGPNDWLNRAWAVRAHRWRRVCLGLGLRLFQGTDLGRFGAGADRN